MTEPQELAALRSAAWSPIPRSPGVYWWYFPASALADLCIDQTCDVLKLQLRVAKDGKVCLYHGLANNLAQRIAWHSAQGLTASSLRSGFLSTLRFTLLALNDFHYPSAARLIDAYFDGLSLSWQATNTKADAGKVEHDELAGVYHYPLNIQGNKRPELSAFHQRLMSARRAYKLLHSGKELRHEH